MICLALWPMCSDVDTDHGTCLAWCCGPSRGGAQLAWKFGEEPVIDAARLSELGAEGFVCAVDRAREVLGVTAAVSLPDGLARTAQWYRQRGWL